MQQQRSLALPSSLDVGPGWLRERRAASLTAYNTSELPQRGIHLWRYTDPTVFLVDTIAPMGSAFAENHVGADEDLGAAVVDTGAE